MKLLAVSGGIASGKSTISRRFVELGAVHIDADQLAREAVEPGSRGLEAVRARFGDEVIAPDGSLDRAELASIVFRDPEKLAALGEIVHPEVRRLFEERLESIAREDADAVVIYDVPLLVEASPGGDWDLVVMAEAPAQTRIERMVNLRGMSREDAERRIANQADDESRRAIADVVVDTGGSEQHTLQQVDEIWHRLLMESSR